MIPDATITTLEAAPAMLAEFVRAIPSERLDVVRRPGFWTIRDHIAHLAEVQPMLHGRLELFRDQDHPRITPYLPDESDGARADGTEVATLDPSDVAGLLEHFSLWRSRQVALIRSFGPEVYGKSGTHPEFSHYSASILIRHIAMHDHWHMYRMEELWLTVDDYLTALE